jgi:DNA-binding CsgD family transcriptional regulator
LLCQECSKRNLCTSLCPEAEVFADQDWVGLKEIAIGTPTFGNVDLDDKLIRRYLYKLYKLPRKEQIGTLIAKGLTREEISQLLGITKKTLRNVIYEDRRNQLKIKKEHIMKVKVKDGYKIRLESGKLLPKVYPSAAAADKRIGQLKMFKSIKNKKHK